MSKQIHADAHHWNRQLKTYLEIPSQQRERVQSEEILRTQEAVVSNLAM
jgi:hypothetical protein